MCSESTTIEALTNLTVGPTKYWDEYAVAPNSIARPKIGQIKGYYFFFRSNYIDMDSIWDAVCMDTESGDLGYYCGFSDDREVIAIHLADPNDHELRNHIEEWLTDSRINKFYFRLKAEEQDLNRHRIFAYE